MKPQDASGTTLRCSLGGNDGNFQKIPSTSHFKICEWKMGKIKMHFYARFTLLDFTARGYNEPSNIHVC